MSNYNKAFAALALGIVSVAVQIVPVLEPVKSELTTIVVSLLTVAAVYAVPNRES
jgi:peptidoglycan/LPS O-acetylase OafA/YrhL